MNDHLLLWNASIHRLRYCENFKQRYLFDSHLSVYRTVTEFCNSLLLHRIPIMRMIFAESEFVLKISCIRRCTIVHCSPRISRCIERHRLLPHLPALLPNVQPMRSSSSSGSPLCFITEERPAFIAQRTAMKWRLAFSVICKHRFRILRFLLSIQLEDVGCIHCLPSSSTSHSVVSP